MAQIEAQIEKIIEDVRSLREQQAADFDRAELMKKTLTHIATAAMLGLSYGAGQDVSMKEVALQEIYRRAEFWIEAEKP